MYSELVQQQVNQGTAGWDIKWDSPPEDKWITVHGYSRNLHLEKTLADTVAMNLQKYNHPFKGGLNPVEWIRTSRPSWWQITPTECGQHDCPYPYPHSSCARTCIGEPRVQGWRQNFNSKEDALEFSRLVMKLSDDKTKMLSYQCSNYPRDSVYCGYLKDHGGGGSFGEYANALQKAIADEKEEEQRQREVAEQQRLEKVRALELAKEVEIQAEQREHNIGLLLLAVPIIVIALLLWRRAK